MKTFDQKFGTEFFTNLPRTPGVYRFLDPNSQVIYVGKAKNLKRRLEQYRNAKRRKNHAKMRLIVKNAERIEFEVFDSEKNAEIREMQLIQTLRPKWNVAGAFYFLYPFIGLRFNQGELQLAFTTQPEPFHDFELHGAFRSRQFTFDAYFSLVHLMQLLGHPSRLGKTEKKGARARYSRLYAFRAIPEDLILKLSSFLQGEKKDFLADLSIELLEKPQARNHSQQVQGELKNLLTFFRHEASPLRQARLKTGHPTYPISQTDRDLIFIQLRHLNPSREKSDPAPLHL